MPKKVEEVMGKMKEKGSEEKVMDGRKKANRKAKVGEVEIINEEELWGKIYMIRGQKVMLDADLAEIYGYTTSAFNQQVKNNIEKFDEDFMFRLTMDDLRKLSMSKNLISISQNVISMQTKGTKGGRSKMPYAFTEQGIYMLMTVLRGELAIKQSKALIRMFKSMKDYIVENRELIESREQLRLAVTAMENSEHIAKIENELTDVDRRLVAIEEKADDMFKKSEISPILLDFNKTEEQRGYVFMDGELMRANELYADIYSKAKKSIYVIDNYVSIKTLRHLQNAKSGVEIVIFSDNSGKYLCKNDYMDFRREREDLEIKFIRTVGMVHDRFIVIDFGTADETIYHCGASEKDAGKRLMMISEFKDEFVRGAMRGVIGRLMKNPELKLR